MRLRWSHGMLGIVCERCGAFIPIVSENGEDVCPMCGQMYRISFQVKQHWAQELTWQSGAAAGVGENPNEGLQ